MLAKRRMSQITKDREYTESFESKRLKRLKKLNAETGLTELNQQLEAESLLYNDLNNPEYNDNGEKMKVKKLTR